MLYGVLVPALLCVQAKPRQRESSGAWEQLMRPKRQAPPPPMSRPVSMEQTEETAGREPPQGAEVREIRVHVGGVHMKQSLGTVERDRSDEIEM